ncbi:Transcription initiation factor TFIID subunit 6 [Linum perenne]
MSAAAAVPKEAIEVIAQSLGISNLSPEVPLALAPDVEYRLREVMQESIKCMRHARRTTLTSSDVDRALSLRNVEPVYGFTSKDSQRFKRAAGHKDLYYVDDKPLEFKDVREAPLPKSPLDTSLTTHWLAIEGVQPIIPENPPLETVSAPADGKRSDLKEDGLPVDIRLPVKHVLSRELQLYFEKIKELTMRRPDSTIFKQALLSLATDSGLHSLVPYFTHFITDEVARNLNNFSLLFALMRVARSLTQNSHIHIEPYLHQLLPSIITCLVAKRLGHRLTDNHWELRNFTANLIVLICKRFGHVYHNLQPRITRTLLHAFLDPTKSLPQHYGAIQGLAALGPSVVRLLILPNIEPYLLLLEPEMNLEKQKNEMKRYEAWRVYGALMCNGKIVTSMSNKRKASSDNLMQQPPLKRMTTEGGGGGGGGMGMMSMNPMQGAAGGRFLPSLVASVSSSNSRQLPGENINMVGGAGRDKTSMVLAQAWKEDMGAGNLLASLFELFVGDGIASVYGLNEIQVGDIVEFASGVKGIVLNLENENVGIVVFGSDTAIKEGDLIKRIGSIVDVLAGKAILGRLVDVLGVPIDGRGSKRSRAKKCRSESP